MKEHGARNLQKGVGNTKTHQSWFRREPGAKVPFSTPPIVRFYAENIVKLNPSWFKKDYWWRLFFDAFTD